MKGDGENCWHRFCEILALPWSWLGRRRLWAALRFHSWPLSFPLAFFYRRTVIRRTRIVAVIGSFGKTTTTRAIAAVLGLPADRVKGWNARGFLAEGIFRNAPGQGAAVLEVGIGHKGRMGIYGRLLKPNVAVVTSIGLEHHRALGSIAEIREEKAKMLKYLPAGGLAILNGDDPNVLCMRNHTSVTVRTVGFNASSDVYASDYASRGLSGGEFRLHVKGQTRNVQTRLVGRHMVHALLAAVTVGLAEGVDLEEALEAVEELTPTNRRLQVLRPVSGPGILLDDYKMTLETVDKALDVLEAVPARHKVVVLGEVAKPPMDEHDVYTELGKRIARIANRLVFVGAQSAYESLHEGTAREEAARLTVSYAGRSVSQAAEQVGSGLTPQDLVLVKGFGLQRLARVGLILAGENMTCDRPLCKAPITVECSECPLLHRSRRGNLR